MLVTITTTIPPKHPTQNVIPATLQIPRSGAWLPSDTTILSTWLKTLITHVSKNPTPLHPIILEFLTLIENNATIYMHFTQMFSQIPRKAVYRQDPSGHPQVRDFHHMLELFNYILGTAPVFDDTCMVGFPINAILDWPMGTPAGEAVFLNRDVNKMVKKMLDVWAGFLGSGESRYVLHHGVNGWLGDEALGAMMGTSFVDDDENDGEKDRNRKEFINTFECEPSKPYWGFTSWDNFFTRKFRDGIRPITSPNDDTVIINACESSPYRISHNIQPRDKFWIKAQPYSLFHILDNDILAEQFIGGKIYQGYLNALSYHRWHCPVNGRIVKTCLIPGTYYSESPYEGFSMDELTSTGHFGDMEGEGPDPEAPNDSQAYITAVATRALIFIQADNEDIGLMCFIAVGMAEVSTCDFTVSVGERVRKGEELGMFHFGGSTHCLLFRKGVELEWDLHGMEDCVGSDGGGNIKVNERIAVVTGKRRVD